MKLMIDLNQICYSKILDIVKTNHKFINIEDHIARKDQILVDYFRYMITVQMSKAQGSP